MWRIAGVEQRVVRRQDRAARDAEDGVDPGHSSDLIRLCAPVTGAEAASPCTVISVFLC